ncbi:MAG TPA: DUF4345 family protein [Rhizobiaceae bacterium]|nr:DUF4345 family protein [Rhizobiaceae bacterium]
MEYAFPWPMSQGEWLAWWSALLTLVFGLLLLFAPGVSLRILLLQTQPERPHAVAQARGTMSGFYLGTALSCLLLAQPFLYIALGLSWALTAFGRIVSMLSDGGNKLYNWVALVVEILLAAGPLLFAFGFIA